MKALAGTTAGADLLHLRTRSPVQGLHLLAEWYGCPRSEAIKRAERLRSVAVQVVREVGFDVVSSLFQQFEPEGVVATIVCADGHLAIHTWPSTGFVAIDVYSCHLDANTRARANELLARLRQLLRPVWVNTAEVNRGVPESGDA